MWQVDSRCEITYYIIPGVSGKMTTEGAGDDDNFGTESSQRVILEILGHERRNRVLAGLYMGRSDTALMVRQAALHVWKIIVSHTPKTLREILSTLFQLLLGCLASQSYDKRQVGDRKLMYNIEIRVDIVYSLDFFVVCFTDIDILVFDFGVLNFYIKYSSPKSVSNRNSYAVSSSQWATSSCKRYDPVSSLWAP